jgi:hypothetical protein
LGPSSAAPLRPAAARFEQQDRARACERAWKAPWKGAAPARADRTLFTFVAEAGSGSQLRCTALNTGEKALDPLSLSLLNGAGTALASNSCPGLGRGEVCAALLSGPTSLIYCQITYKGSRKAVRGTLQVVDASGNSVLNLEAR